jgi:DNA-binding MarR family transcriptional regulator
MHSVNVQVVLSEKQAKVLKVLVADGDKSSGKQREASGLSSSDYTAAINTLSELGLVTLLPWGVSVTSVGTLVEKQL